MRQRQVRGRDPWLGIAGMCVSLLLPTTALAAPARAAEGPAGHSLSLAGRATNFGYGGLVDYRVRLPRRHILVGLHAASGYTHTAFIAGHAVRRNAVVEGRIPFLFPVTRRPKFSIALGLVPGVRYTRSSDPGPSPYAQSVAVTTDAGVWSYSHLHPRVTLKAGFDVSLSFQVDPEPGVDRVGGVIGAGLIVPINDRLQWFVDGATGGLFGSGGDAEKFLASGTTGFRVVFGASAARWRMF